MPCSYAENEQSQAFPTILGFAKAGLLDRNAARLLAEEDTYSQPAPSGLGFDPAHDLPVACWLRWGEFDEINCAPFLLCLDNAELGYLRQHYGDLMNRTMVETLQAIASEAGVGLEDIIELYGRPTRPDYLDAIRKRQQEEEYGEEKEGYLRMELLSRFAGYLAAAGEANI